MLPQKILIDGYLENARPRWDAIEFDVECPDCKYNLRTLTSERCPECGRVVEWPPILEQAVRRAGAAALISRGRPMWEVIRFDLACGRCGFRLNGHDDPVCPTCGLRFVWLDALDAAWTDRTDTPGWGRILAQTMRPDLFWRRMSLYARVPVSTAFSVAIRGTLMIWVASIVLGGFVSLFLLDFNSPHQCITEAHRALGINSDRPMPHELIFATWTFFGCAVSLGGLRQTLGRCRVRIDQIIRVVGFSLPAIALSSAAFALLLGQRRTTHYHSPLPIGVAAFGIAGVITITTIYIGIPLKVYLHLPRPFLLAFAAALLSVLSYLTCFVLLAIA